MRERLPGLLLALRAALPFAWLLGAWLLLLLLQAATLLLLLPLHVTMLPLLREGGITARARGQQCHQKEQQQQRPQKQATLERHFVQQRPA